MSVVRSLVVLLSCPFLCGCVPVIYDWIPGASGTVVDKQTQMPLVGAKIQLVGPVDPGRGDQHFESETDDRGRFSFQPKRRIWLRPLLPIPIDPVADQARLTITKEGYKQSTTWAAEDATIALQRIAD